MKTSTNMPEKKKPDHSSQSLNITKLYLMIGLHLISMFFLMYAMIATQNHFYLNINNLYMAALMTTPMVILEVLLMGSMYGNKKMLQMIAGSAVVVFAFLFFFIREQIGVTDTQFLKSMIPHHSSAILMCEKAAISDPEIRELCTEIIQTQKEEIEIMERKLLERE